MKPCTAIRQLIQPAQVFDDGNARAEQRGMDRPMAIIGAVDIERIDPSERRARGDKALRQRAREIRMVFEILVGPPVRVPAGMKEDGRALQVLGEGNVIDRALLTRDRTDHHAAEICERFERKL